MNERHDDLQEIIDAALREMAAEEGDGFDPQACNLAEFCRRTGLTRSRARTVRAHAVGTGADSWCEGQWETSPAQPEELPTQPVGTVVEQIAPPRAKPGFERFDFGRAE